AVVVVFPTPPLPEVMTITLPVLDIKERLSSCER
ncbi:MAG: hypothetical protein JWL77_5155, partial [Chthonomonadaceae bacterium]|nr:hypothetical protein [Chthonomonadaceae bacterium]